MRSSESIVLGKKLKETIKKISKMDTTTRDTQLNTMISELSLEEQEVVKMELMKNLRGSDKSTILCSDYDH